MEKRFLQDNILAAPYRREQWIDVLKKVFGAKSINQNPPTVTNLSANKLADGAWELGSLTTADDRLIGIFEIKVKPNVWIERNRLGLRELLRSIYKNEVDGALIVFDQGEKWRFSFVSEIRVRSEQAEDEIEERKTEPKRYTYLFGEGESCRTAAERFLKLEGKPIHLNDLFEAFSIEKLNKEFFETYKANYEKFCKFLANKSEYADILEDKKETEKDKIEKPIRNFTKVLLGRMVFLQFLQKKGWMGVPASNVIWSGGDAKFIQSLFNRFGNKDEFHSTCLKTLFFETLNTKRDDDLAPASISSGTSIKIPYLNGGLFDKDLSYFHKIDFPADYFKELLDFFERYNFTIDENDPYDREMGIDPEMLGHIFENLLEENREKGTFYTPKEIVHYMCQESLIQYVRTHLPECTDDESPATRAVESFIRTGGVDRLDDPKNFIVKNAKRIEVLLDRVKICDPAIGSGAFPMGMLQVIFKSKMALDLTLDRATVKKEIIQNTIYGVDVEKGAVDIARLRFWLALVVDEDEPQPLPNLDYKIMQGNSLFESFESIDLRFEPKRFEVKIIKEVDLFGKPINPQISITEYLQSKEQLKEFSLKDLEDKYFNSNNAQEKLEIKRKIDAFEKEFIEEQVQKREGELRTLIKAKKDSNEPKKRKEYLLHEEELVQLNEVKKLLNELRVDNKPYFLWHLYFMDVFLNGGFDIVIANPPYGTSIKGKDREKLVSDFGKVPDYEIFYFFIELAKRILKPNGVKAYIIPNTILFNVYAADYRIKLTKDWSLQNILDCTSFNIFQSATVRNVILFLKKSHGSSRIGYKSTELISNFLDLTNQPTNYISVDTVFNSNKNWGLLFKLRGDVINLVNKIKSGSIDLHNFFPEISQGLIAYDKYRGQDEDTIKNRIYHSFEKKPGYKKWLWGEDITRYSVKWNHKEYINYTDGIANPREPKFFKGKRILIREITNPSIYAGFADFEAYNDPSIIIVKAGTEDFAVHSLLGILNSKLSTFYHFNSSPKATKGAFPKILVEDIRNFPLPAYDTNKKFLNVIAKLSQEIVTEKENGKESLGRENKVDAIVFHIYNLNESEMLRILDTFKDLSIKDRTQIHNEYRNIKLNKLSITT